MGSDADAAAGAAPREREAEIEKAMRARVPDFKKQADSLTLEGVRRALEKDLGLEIYSLDAYKKFIKQCVDKVFAESDEDNTNDNASEDAEAKHLSKEGSDDAKPTPVSNKTSSADAQVVKSSETGKDPEEEKDKISSSDISEDIIKEAIEKRASYFRKNSETLTLQGVRRTLEEDLKLQKKALDAYKNFITTQLDKVLQEPANGTMKKSKKGPPMDTDRKASKGPKGSKRARADSNSSELENSQSEMEDSDEDTRPRKKRAEKAKVIKKQKKVPDEKKLSTPKAKKVAKKDSDRSGDEQGGSSAEDNSHSSSEEDNKRKRQQASAPAPAYGKHVEHLKSIIKSCGMTIPPTVYRKAKQAPEHKREACLIKELEDMLEKEGLSKNPSEKEIKAVKKRKERAKELEGIDTSNIITSSRHRSTSSFIPLPPPPKIEADSDDEDGVAKDDDEDDEENLEDEDAGDNDDAEAGDGSGDDAAKDSD